MNVGRVSLVGAGPGDPDLLTVRAVRRLREADLVLYDALVNREVLRHAERAHCFFVGKRAGRIGVKQETIHRILIDAARRGKRVVRLKCGDPFVLGRGGEEALAMAEDGIPCEVVPCLSAALAASTPSAFTWTGMLSELGSAELPDSQSDAPGTLVIGAVVSLAEATQVPESHPVQRLSIARQSP